MTLLFLYTHIIICYLKHISQIGVCVCAYVRFEFKTRTLFDGSSRKYGPV